MGLGPDVLATDDLLCSFWDTFILILPFHLGNLPQENEELRGSEEAQRSILGSTVAARERIPGILGSEL